ncbi:tetratricopeptide repeat protein [Salipaludibacillus daqingensis]|uniref:tetratricopeptide repeat protein n=1 Tax=Salipaludibacillus daqingensis TaxID=3041001 RepID=UPI002474C4DE|nr:tetratricopeptide repeat protein [Salipaludibacillus daqingensis]
MEEDKGHFWGIVSTRPFMRAKEAYGIALKASGQQQKAIDQFEQMLDLNPNDNQGIRYVLCDAYLEEKNEKAANRLLERYKEDNGAHFQYNRVLAEYLNNGQSKRLKEKITDALEENAHVPDYLLKRKKYQTTSLIIIDQVMKQKRKYTY